MLLASVNGFCEGGGGRFGEIGCAGAVVEMVVAVEFLQANVTFMVEDKNEVVMSAIGEARRQIAKQFKFASETDVVHD